MITFHEAAAGAAVNVITPVEVLTAESAVAVPFRVYQFGVAPSVITDEVGR